MNSHPNLVSSANWQSRDLHSSPVIFLRGSMYAGFNVFFSLLNTCIIISFLGHGCLSSDTESINLRCGVGG